MQRSANPWILRSVALPMLLLSAATSMVRAQQPGAASDHWAWQPLADEAPPAGVAAHPIDAFVLSRLRANDLEPSPPAPGHQQLRRLWLDLVGLPPPAELARSFPAEPDDDAWSEQVDTLLASPRFGERWARHWLDLVRYSETLGHEFDYELPNAWRYRDYVIRAFNQDLPYDRFVREHVAGDLLDPPRLSADGTRQSIVATAAWWFVEQTHSPVDALQHQADRIDNQIDVLGKAFLGTTIACARCHDHKFDPIPTRDYYSLFGYVQSSRYVQAPIRPCAVDGVDFRAALEAQRELAARWHDIGPDNHTAPRNANATGTEASTAAVRRRPDDVVVAHADGSGTGGGWYVTNDGFGPAPWLGPFCARPDAARPVLRELPGPFWLSCVAGAEREATLATANFTLDRRYVHVRVAGSGARVKLIVDGFQIVRDPIYGHLHRQVDRPEAHWLTFDLDRWRGHSAFVQAIDQRAPDLGDPHRNRSSYANDAWIAVQAVVLSPHASPPSGDDGGRVFDSDAARTRADWRRARAELVRAQGALPVSPTVPAMADGDGRDGRVFVRGDHHQPGEAAPRRFLSMLCEAVDAAPTRSSGRLQLADAMLADDNPLPARVLVNRVWHHLFGRGIVKSVDNFGALGDRPSHPALLDWLAQDLRRHDWSLKHVVRRIATSRTYRQQSRRNATAEAIDGGNTLLHRQNVRPLEAGALRDALLSISARLDTTMYGPSVPPPRDTVTSARGSPSHFGPLDGAGRRTVYLAIRRNFLPGFLLAFDLPTPFATVGRRNTSNVPAQGLALANDALVHELCADFASRVLAEADGRDARIDHAFLLAFARLPADVERRRILAFLEAAEGPPERRWTDVVHALVNTTEFRFRR